MISNYKHMKGFFLFLRGKTSSPDFMGNFKLLQPFAKDRLNESYNSTFDQVLVNLYDCSAEIQTCALCDGI